MASIRKLSRDKGKKNKPYYIQYFDADGKRVTAKGFTDKGLTEQLAAKLENEVMLRKRGMIDPAQERLLSIKQSPISGHLDAFDRSMANNTPKHRKLTMTRVRRVVEGCGFLTLSEMDGEKVVDWLNATRETEDLGARTFNHYMQAADAFGKWLAATKRLPSNPLAGMERLNSETDIRHKRRALSTEEVSRLVESARLSGEVVQGYNGELRARAYLLSFFTGLRRQEIGSMTPRSFKLDDAQPTLVVEAACSKHRRKDTLPMHPDLVGMVREWVRDLGPDDLLFPRIERKKTWYMVKKDLERIGIPYETHEGIADFHAAGRHSHITGLLRNGATLVEARQLARHADVRMTMKYTHIGLQDQADALAGLPYPKTCTKRRLAGFRAASWVRRFQLVAGKAAARVSRKTKKPLPRKGFRRFLASPVRSWHLTQVMEAAGIAPASRDPSVRASTCVADHLIVGLDTPIGGVIIGLACRFFSSCRNGRLGTSDPALSSPADPSGRRVVAMPLLL